MNISAVVPTNFIPLHPPREHTSELLTHHHHARHPEEHDVVPGLEQRGRVKGRHIGGVVRPAKDRKRKEAGREPGVEDVRVADD
jgi:hypothetical protein